MATMYVKDESGATFIPATQRPDGTWRKARRVKDGYVPQEEVPLYESKGKQFAKNRSSLPPGLSREDADKIEQSQSTVQSRDIVGLSKSAKKNAKKKEKKKQAQNSGAHVSVEDLSENLSRTELNDTVAVKDKKGNQPIATDPVKRLKNLRKKLREIEALKLKIEAGELENPDKDQLEKISRQDQVEKEIEDLELLIDE